jgi:Ca-activated chloride channel family protein
VPIEASAGRDLGGEHALITLAEQTGGKSFYVSAGGLAQGFRAGKRRSADPILARLLSKKSRARKGIFTAYRSLFPGPRRSEFNIRHKTGYYLDMPAKGN